MSTNSEGECSNSSPNYRSSFTAEDFRQYEQRLNSPCPKRHSTLQHAELTDKSDLGAVPAESSDSGTSEIDATPERQVGCFTADTFRRYEEATKGAVPATGGQIQDSEHDPWTMVRRPDRVHQRTLSSMTASTVFGAMDELLPTCTKAKGHGRTLSSESVSTVFGIEEVQESLKWKPHQRTLSSDTTATVFGAVDEKAELQIKEEHVPSPESYIVGSEKDLEAAFPAGLDIPDKVYPRPIRNIRYTLWNVYRRLFSIVFAINAIAMIVYLCKNREISKINIWHLATATSANIFVGTTLRQDYIQKILYSAGYRIPHSAPLRLRRILAKIYELGGVHSGSGVAGTIWFIALTVVLSIQYSRGIFTSGVTLGLTYALQSMLIMICVLAYPALRSKSHNTFEMSHRFFGWTLIAIFWAELGLIAAETASKQHINAGMVLVKQPSFWLLVLITFHTILPWLRLRRWDFRAENLSNHAVRLHYQGKTPPFTGISISRSPLMEWHPFATMPALNGESTGGSLIVSAAGDWTKEAVQNPQPRYWVKGWPRPGVLSMSPMFKRVVIVTTGSGIGPCLSIIASPFRKNQCRILWSSPSPEKIFGRDICDTVRRADKDAVIIDSRRSGRPDMVAITYRLFVESNAEAVFVISNPKLTRKIVYSMECRGVPAFGPVWDS